MTYKLPEGWSMRSLKDITKRVKVGFVGSCSKHYCNSNEGVPMIRTTNLRKNKVLLEDVKYITKDFYDKNKKSQLKYQDILIARHGKNGLASLWEKDIEAQCLNAIIVETDKSLSNPNYLTYAINSKIVNNQIIARTGGSVQSVVNTKAVAEVLIPYPPLPEQKAIAETLSSLDDKIELNNKINENLEEQAQAIFKHWFVDFEFPDQEGNPYKSSGGEMVESELGMIPKGWKVGKLDDIIELHDSKRIPLSKKQRDTMEKNYPYYGATSVIDYVEEYIFDGTYLLLGEDGSVSDDAGYPILQYVWGKIWVNNHAHVITGKGVNTVEYLYLLLKNTNVNNIITGAVQKKINQRNLKSLEVLIPEEELLLQYIKTIEPIFKKRKLLETQNQKLSQLRDTLLPKLMNGELRIPLD